MWYLPDKVQKLLTKPKTNFRSALADDRDDIRFGDLFAAAEEQKSIEAGSIALLGVPQDIGVHRNGGRIGAANAPSAIRERLYKLTPGFSVDTPILQPSVYDIGDVLVEEQDTLEVLHERQTQVVRYLLELGATVVVIGGGHDIAYPNGVALAELHEHIAVLNIDAHCDVRPFKSGKRHSGSPFRQLFEHRKGLLPEGHFVEFGIHKHAAALAHTKFIAENGGKVLFFEDIPENFVYLHFQEVIAKIQQKIQNSQNLYCTFDMDAVQMAFAPGVSAPAAIGFTANEACRFCYHIGSTHQTAIFDIVEVNPLFDIDDKTARLAALMIASFVRGRKEANSHIDGSTQTTG